MHVHRLLKDFDNYLDGDENLLDAIENWCDYRELPYYVGDAVHAALIERDALEAGIPLSVIRRKTRLIDHFPREYIDMQINKK